MKPTFSIITVTYNAASTIARTLDSIASQTFTDYEHIIVDGASKDDTLTIIESIPTRNRQIVSESDEGLYYAMNKGMGRATGEYLIFMNAGDTFSDDDALHRIADTAKRTHADVVYGQTQITDMDGNIIGMRHLTAPKNLQFHDFLRGMLVCHQAFVARRKLSPEFNTRYRYSADYEWCLRILKRSARNAYCGGIIVNFLDGGTTNAHHKDSLKERFHIMGSYYGYHRAILRHLSFIPRYLRRKYQRKSV